LGGLFTVGLPSRSSNEVNVMPIFEKNGRRILFVHIPKTAGTSIYSAFARSGYTIKCLRTDEKKTSSAYMLLKQKYGVVAHENPDMVPVNPHLLSVQFSVELALIMERYLRTGKRKRPRLTPIQHAPHSVWKRWGEFDDIFTVVRDPMTRLESALRYNFKYTASTMDFDDFCRDGIRRASIRPWGHWSILHGHLIPQHYFVSKTTKIFKFESDWKREICYRFDLDFDEFPRENATVQKDMSSALDLKKWAGKKYRRDFKKFGYIKSIRA